MMIQKPDKLYIEEKVKYYPLTEKIICKLAPISVEFVDDYRKIGEEKPFPQRAAEYKNGIIEFRTKSTNISNLTSIKNPPKNIIQSWTFSPERVVKSIEHKTPSFEER